MVNIQKNKYNQYAKRKDETRSESVQLKMEKAEEKPPVTNRKQLQTWLLLTHTHQKSL